MKQAVIFLAVGLIAAGLFWALRAARPRVPFYISNTRALRQLPLDDLLRMRDDILTASAALPDTRVTAPALKGRTFAKGALSPLGKGRVATGRIELVELPDGQRVARLQDFGVTNGPELKLLLSTAMDAGVTPENSKSLGPLEGNAGDQNFTIPAQVDVPRMRTAVIWCDLFGTVFASAPLEPPDR